MVRSGESLCTAKETPFKLNVTVLWLSIAVWGWVWLGPTWVGAMWPSSSRITDFYQDWGSARNHALGLPVYTHHAISIPRHLGIPADPADLITYNAHPPVAVLLILPLAQLEYKSAILVWNVISLLSLVLSLKIVVTELDVRSTVVPQTVALLAVCHPIYGNLYLGQLTLVLLLLVTMIWALVRSDRLIIAGALVGIAAAIKLFPAYLIIFFLVCGRTQALGAALLSFLGINAVAIHVLGADTYHDYLSIVLPGQAQFWSCGYNLSITGIWHKLFNPAIEGDLIRPLWLNPALARWGTVVSDVLLTLTVTRCTYRTQTRAQEDLAFGVINSAMLLVAPVTWDFTLPLLLVPIALILHWPGTIASRWIPAVLALLLIIIWIPQNTLTALINNNNTFNWLFMLGAPSLKFYSLVGIFTLGLITLHRERHKIGAHVSRAVERVSV